MKKKDQAVAQGVEAVASHEEHFSLLRIDPISRRSLLRGGVAAVALAALSSCDSARSKPGSSVLSCRPSATSWEKRRHSRSPEPSSRSSLETAARSSPVPSARPH